ncbi:MAG: tRNA pseudouridine13 synthase [Planctomycetota bacterium]|jgi:tRNA pseudouridine13 synthase
MKTGTIRAKTEDFFVDEVVPERVAQEGEHLHIRIEKRDLSTEAAVRMMAKDFGVSPKSIGRCGRKDVRSVARQWLSFTGVKEEQVDALDIPGIHVLEHVRLPRKLRMGRFLGNRFRIRVRDLSGDDISRAQHALGLVERRGLPNAYGEQRLGENRINARIGRLLIQGDIGEALALHVESNSGRDAERMRRHLAEDRFEDALRVLGRRRAGFLVSAWQAEVFNRVLALRSDTVDQALEGDVLHQHSSGRTLVMEDQAAAAQGVADLEYSATGPLPGPSMREVTGAALEIEGPVLAEEACADSERRRWFGCTGARRSLRVPVTEAEMTRGLDDLGSYLEVSFRLPPGAFATTLLDVILR